MALLIWHIIKCSKNRGGVNRLGGFGCFIDCALMGHTYSNWLFGWDGHGLLVKLAGLPVIEHPERF